ncbi:DUF998 domain-containing protein [Microlunatus soli]|uniref:DUF998 domain-containing protein n=1 Tax=Microlunatus soli TaxID=630515 RepID=A0A1H1QEI6_9ACTN|nr:DUF998 domain-containing protein [Microlunatus soli]SDS21733.1 Protein of unknown function [Microlunatus soli]
MIITLAAGLTALLVVARLVIFVALHFARSDYNVVEHAVSDYHVGRTRRLATAMTWLTAASWATLAVCVAAGFPGAADRGSMLAQLIALVVIFVVLPFLPTDVEGSRRTVIGILHYLAAIAWFALAYSLTGNFTRLITHPTGLATTLGILHWIALVSLIALIVALLLKPLRRFAFGIAERIFLLTIGVFYAITAIAIAVR